MMMKFFKYNWQVRDEWFIWCEQLTNEDLLKKRTGGVGSILYTLFHIVDVEYSWIRCLQGKEDITFQFQDYNSLNKIKSLSNTCRHELMTYLSSDLNENKDELITVPWDDEKYTKDEIIHHVITHEIHHIGQLSVWSRELELAPVSASYIGREISDERISNKNP